MGQDSQMLWVFLGLFFALSLESEFKFFSSQVLGISMLSLGYTLKADIFFFAFSYLRPCIVYGKHSPWRLYVNVFVISELRRQFKGHGQTSRFSHVISQF